MGIAPFVGLYNNVRWRINENNHPINNGWAISINWYMYIYTIYLINIISTPISYFLKVIIVLRHSKNYI